APGDQPAYGPSIAGAEGNGRDRQPSAAYVLGYPARDDSPGPGVQVDLARLEDQLREDRSAQPRAVHLARDVLGERGRRAHRHQRQAVELEPFEDRTLGDRLKRSLG